MQSLSLSLPLSNGVLSDVISDFGATHEDHPMINRTIVDGESASYLYDIRTK